ncbi:sugar-binding domain-containing protein [Bacillus sp. CECT 9360]|uniref:sugar-binding transcriptional regulator n=1 Tax=Bacillus sp. CECT 9360 TaxID=2845821 RepID=UPI001E5B29C3|nr:sugar-binding domain-containing protein [Bacillus sp. CECT 9360]CAH0344777.1 Central glycolytic genes regulator [Bacillus sp. CECT 9360]
MRSLLDVQRKLLPDLMAVMQKRYDILRYIKIMQPVGRRSLAVSLNLTERTLRSEVDFLKEQQLIHVFTSGMQLSVEGEDILEKLEGIMREVTGIDLMEQELKRKLKLQQVIIVAGDSDQLPWVKSELGKACANRMKQEFIGENIIAVTGGSTIAEVANMLTPALDGKDLVFVPARGGLGEDVHNQANMIVSKMAEKTNAAYRVLYIPDQVSKEAYKSFMKDPTIKEVISLIQSANIVIHGVGDALAMAERRKTSPEIMKVITEGNAVGEAFGYYFNENGDVVHKVQTVGIQLDDLKDARSVIAVAGGKSKAKAIRSYMKTAPSSTVLITDEAAAKELLKG